VLAPWVAPWVAGLAHQGLATARQKRGRGIAARLIEVVQAHRCGPNADARGWSSHCCRLKNDEHLPLRNGAGVAGVGLLREVTVLSPHVPRPLLQTTSTEGPGFHFGCLPICVAQRRLPGEAPAGPGQAHDVQSMGALSNARRTDARYGEKPKPPKPISRKQRCLWR
jgi:hypothetical protein